MTGLWLGASALASGLLENLRLDLRSFHRADLTPEQAQSLFAFLFGRILELVGYFLGLMFAGVWLWQPCRWVFRCRRSYSPFGGRSYRRRLAGRGCVSGRAARCAVMVLKITIVAAVAVWILNGRSVQIILLGQSALASGVSQAWGIVMRLALAVAAVLVLIGLVDYLFQRWRHEQSLLMTRQELKEDMKRDEGDPQIRARLRKLHAKSPKDACWTIFPGPR